MEIPPGIGLLSVAVLVLANGFFVATEFAIVAVRRSRLEQLVQEGHRGAVAAKEVVSHLDAYIAACQLGITMASLSLGWIGEPVLAGLLEGPLTLVLGATARGAAHGMAVAIAFAVITALHIVIGELAPKGVALQRPEATTLWVARPLRVFYGLFRWPISALNAVGNGVLRLVGLQVSTGHEMVHTAEELRLLVTASQQAGTVEASEARIAARAFKFADLTAGEIMTPRAGVASVAADQTLEEVREVARAAGHSHLPLYDGSLDNVVGVLHVSSLLARAPATTASLRDLAGPPALIPITRRADDVLEDMRQGGFEFAVVLDEYGVTAGVITLHDLMEALVGPMGTSNRARAVGMPLADGSRLLDGLVRLSELEEVSGIRVPEEERSQADTLNGLVMLRLGRVPHAGDVVSLGTWTLHVESLAHQRVGRARLVPHAASPAGSAPHPPEPKQGAPPITT